MQDIKLEPADSLDKILEADSEAREYANTYRA